MKIKLLVVFTLFLITLSYSVSDTDNPIEKCESLIVELEYYDALVALEPLLTDNKKSEDQEKALWLANMLSERLEETISSEKWKAQGLKDIDKREIEYEKVMNKFKTLNQYGARFSFFEMAGDYLYHYGFLKRLVDLYPNSEWRPAAEYYLIQEGSPIPEDPVTNLELLNDYVKKYEKSGLTEIYLAYLDIAIINHGFWAFLAHPDEDPFGMGEFFSSGDPEKDKIHAAECKAEALKYYAMFILSGFQGKYTEYTNLHKEVLEYYKSIKQNKPYGYSFLVID